MGDQLENFIQSNREYFDVEPSMDRELRWSKIQQRIPNRKSKLGTLIWKIAAMLFLATTVTLMVDKYTETDVEFVSDRHEEFRQAEAFYTTLISQKRNEIARYETELLSEEFVQEINQLDVLYDELKNTFDHKVNDNKLLDAMIHNLQLRIDILNQQLKILETLNNTKNEKVQAI